MASEELQKQMAALMKQMSEQKELITKLMSEKEEQAARNKAEKEDLEKQMQELRQSLSAEKTTSTVNTSEDQNSVNTRVAPQPPPLQQPLPPPPTLPTTQQQQHVVQAAPAQIQERYPFNMTADSLPKFSGDDVAQAIKPWIKRVTEDAQVYQWSPAETLLAAKRALEGSAKIWCDAQEGLASWDILRTRLEMEFGKSISMNQVHGMLLKRKRGKDESMQRYLLEMEKIGAQAGVTGSDIQEYIAKGVTDDPTILLVLTNARTRQEFKGLLERYQKQLENDMPKSSNSQSSRSSSKPKDTSQSRPERCYICGIKEHHGSICPDRDKGKLCFKCHKPGHLKRDCGQTRSNRETHKSDEIPIHLVQNGEVSRSRKDITVGDTKLQAIIDSGAKVNVMRIDAWEKIDCKAQEIKEYSSTLRGLGGAAVSTKGQVSLDTVLDNATYRLDYVLVSKEALYEEVLIGDPLRDVAKITLVANQTIVEPLQEKNEVQMVTERAKGSENSTNENIDEPQVNIQSKSEAPEEVKTVMEKELHKEQKDEVTKPRLKTTVEAISAFEEEVRSHVSIDEKPLKEPRTKKRENDVFYDSNYGFNLNKRKFVLIGKTEFGRKRTKGKTGKIRIFGLSRNKKGEENDQRGK